MNSMLLLDCKIEPTSPANINNEEVVWFDEDTFYQTLNDIENDEIKLENNDNKTSNESKAEVAAQILEDLENLVDLDELIKEEPYLLDAKFLPILHEVDQQQSISSCPITTTTTISPQENCIKMEYIIKNSQDSTQNLLKEFETVYDVIGLTHETLTPPQSPPNQLTPPILTTLEPLLNPTTQETINNYNNNNQRSIINIDYSPQPQDLEHELAVVDELVRTRYEQWESESPSSPNSNSGGSSSSNFDDCSSDDPEWIPETIETYEDDNNNNNNNNLNDFAISSSTTTTTTTSKATTRNNKRSNKPYSRGTTIDKKSRKKEQNKNAATRYRMKKKAEVEVILGEEKGLINQNDNLNNQIIDLQREIKYLKGLMRDLFKAKGLIN